VQAYFGLASLAAILDSVTVEDWGEKIFAEGVGVKWKNGQRGRGRGRKQFPNPYPRLCTNPLPVKHPVTIQDGGIEPIYLAFGSEITPALQATLTSLEKRLLLKCSRMRENYWNLYYETKKKPRRLCPALL